MKLKTLILTIGLVLLLATSIEAQRGGRSGGGGGARESAPRAASVGPRSYAKAAPAPRTQGTFRGRAIGPTVNGRIPIDRFRANFGRLHPFRPSLAFYPGFPGRYPRFWFGGYWFYPIGPFPPCWYWGNDYVYIDYIDGQYILYNLYCPGPGIMLAIGF
jgi:hypothetical protein